MAGLSCSGKSGYFRISAGSVRANLDRQWEPGRLGGQFRAGCSRFVTVRGLRVCLEPFQESSSKGPGEVAQPVGLPPIRKKREWMGHGGFVPG